MSKQLKVIISGGGTGGHIFPAVSIANAIKDIDPNADFCWSRRTYGDATCT